MSRPPSRLAPTSFLALDPRFPAALRALPRPPRQLWVDGRLPGPGEPLIAIVGSRAASRAACAAVAGLAGELTGAGYTVVSGGALGIDAAAHRGALASGGATFAVLGCGIDVVYPDRHGPLFRDIAAAGGLLSEHGPGVAPRPWQFPARNRLVAALARAVIVAECRPGSGALITAGLARRFRRPLLAMPGSPGAERLLARGLARPVACVEDVVRALAAGAAGHDGGGPGDPTAADAARAALAGDAGVTPELAAIVAALEEASAPADVLARRLGRPLAEVLGTLCEAELSGFVVRAPGGRYEVPRGN